MIRRLRPEKKRRKNHIKYVFMFRNKSEVKYSIGNQKPQYLFAYLTDDNKISYDEFVVRHTRTFNRGTIVCFLKKVERRYIDENTEIFFFFGEKDYRQTDIMFMLWRIFHAGMKFRMQKVSIGGIAYCLNRMLGLNLIGDKAKDARNCSFNQAMKILNEIFDIVLKNRICPWIDDDFNERISRIRALRRRMYKITSLGMYYVCIQNYVASKKKMAKFKRDLEKSGKDSSDFGKALTEKLN